MPTFQPKLVLAVHYVYCNMQMVKDSQTYFLYVIFLLMDDYYCGVRKL